jgi:hypothetical protein
MRLLFLGYICLYIYRPFEIWPVLETVRLELLYMLVTGGMWLLAPGKRWAADGFHWAFLAFAFAVVASWLASPYNHLPQPDAIDYVKLLPFYLMLVTLVKDEKQLHAVILTFLFALTIYMGHSLWEYVHGRHVVRMNTVRLLGINTSMGDANHCAHSIVYSLPFLIPAWAGARSVWARLFVAGYAVLALGCIALTGSRSALVGVLLCVAITVWRSRWRGRLIVLGVLAAPLCWGVLPENLQKRFETIIDPSVGPANAKESADLRWVGLNLGFELWDRYPLTGCGPGFWIPATHSKVQSHMLYGQVMGELGTLGILTFAGILLVYAWKLRRLGREYRRHPEWGRDYVYQVIQAVGCALLVMIVLGNSLHTLFRYNWVWYAGFLAVADQCVRRRGAGGEPRQELWSAAAGRGAAWA